MLNQSSPSGCHLLSEPKDWTCTVCGEHGWGEMNLVPISNEQIKALLDNTNHYSNAGHLYGCEACGVEMEDLTVILWDVDAELAVCPYCGNQCTLSTVECGGC